MIVRINGAFGAGETTLAQELHRRLLDALPFYPDAVRVVATTVLKVEVGADSCVVAGDLAARATPPCPTPASPCTPGQGGQLNAGSVRTPSTDEAVISELDSARSHRRELQ